MENVMTWTSIKSELINEIGLVDSKVELPNSQKCNSSGSDVTEPYNSRDYPKIVPMDESNCSTQTESYGPTGCIRDNGNPDESCNWCQFVDCGECPFCDEDL